MKRTLTEGRAVSGSNRSFIEIQVVGVDLAKPSSILAGRMDQHRKILARKRLSRSQIVVCAVKIRSYPGQRLAFLLDQKSRDRSLWITWFSRLRRRPLRWPAIDALLITRLPALEWNNELNNHCE